MRSQRIRVVGTFLIVLLVAAGFRVSAAQPLLGSTTVYLPLIRRDPPLYIDAHFHPNRRLHCGGSIEGTVFNASVDPVYHVTLEAHLPSGDVVTGTTRFIATLPGQFNPFFIGLDVAVHCSGAFDSIAIESFQTVSTMVYEPLTLESHAEGFAYEPFGKYFWASGELHNASEHGITDIRVELLGASGGHFWATPSRTSLGAGESTTYSGKVYCYIGHCPQDERVIVLSQGAIQP
jgi:hypothetical protein